MNQSMEAMEKLQRCPESIPKCRHEARYDDKCATAVAVVVSERFQVRA